MLLAACEAARAKGELFEFVGNGISACVDNAESLAQDLAVLIEQKRTAAAQFIYATCMEEMGKASILLDMVRADCRPDGRLKLLCKAFYSHLKKYGYAKTVVVPALRIRAALDLYRLRLIEYWPNRDPEDGTPDEVADVFAHREWAIYVDWVEYDGRWSSPRDSSLANLLAGEGISGTAPARREVSQLLAPLLRAKTEGLFSAASLRVIHEEFSPHYISERFVGDIQPILARVQDRLARSGSNVTPQTLAANFMRYPLYAAIFEEPPNPVHRRIIRAMWIRLRAWYCEQFIKSGMWPSEVRTYILRRELKKLERARNVPARTHEDIAVTEIAGAVSDDVDLSTAEQLLYDAMKHLGKIPTEHCAKCSTAVFTHKAKCVDGKFYCEHCVPK
jgi:AbiV family abortive infection protein